MRTAAQSAVFLRSALVLAVAGSLLAGGDVIAQEENAQPFRIGDSRLFPALRVEFVNNDNAFLTADNEEEASNVVLQPSLVWQADRGTTELEATYGGEYQSSDIDALEYDDHFLGASAAAVLTRRQRVEGGVSLELGHEAVGTDLLLGVGSEADEPVTFQEFIAQAAYIYGAENARGNFEVGTTVETFSYDSYRNAEGVDITDGRDYTLLEPFALLSLRLGGATRALFGGSVGSYSYDAEERDRTDYGLFTGLEFTATGTLFGEARLGVTRAEFDGNRDDQDTVTARAAVTYTPSSFSRWRLVFDREFDNRTGLVDAAGNDEDRLTVEDRIRLDWNYGWSQRVVQRVFVQRTSYDRECPLELDTATISGGLELSFFVRRWLEFGAGIEQQARSADECGPLDAEEVDSLEYDRQLLSAHVRVTL